MALKCLGLPEVDAHVHLAIHRGRGGVELSGLLALAGAVGELAESEYPPRITFIDRDNRRPLPQPLPLSLPRQRRDSRHAIAAS